MYKLVITWLKKLYNIVKMPRFNRTIIDDYRILINQTGKRAIKVFKCKPLKWIPYFSGADIDLILEGYHVNTNAANSISINYNWILFIVDDSGIEHQVDKGNGIFELFKTKTSYTKFKIDFICKSGEYKLKTIYHNLETNSIKQISHSFSVLEYDKIVLEFIGGLLVLAGSILGSILTIVIQKVIESIK